MALEALGTAIQKQVILAPFTSTKIGGPAEYFFEARTKEEFIQAISQCKQEKIPFFILGGGTNCIISDAGIKGLVIRPGFRQITFKGMVGTKEKARTVFIEADTGVFINALVRYTIEEGLAGLEAHLGLPGTVGGAIYMNSKWTHPVSYVGDVVVGGTIVNEVGEIEQVPQSFFKFAYDYSILQDKPIYVVSVTFGLERGESTEVLWQRANESMAYRRATQPQGIFSAGCTFQNISLADAIRIGTPDHTQSAGYLLDSCGLKGVQIGRAQISPEHANFIQNLGGATAKDIWELTQRAIAAVQHRYGITLVPEVRFVGEGYA